ncbi:hypothetical protein AAE02nite_01820 [Adhaeribacter aerolatus]|uniref:DUF4127 domain-containing protein n=1 Tax=Adhaeribacter aerolatus TaxID=670289 RepID=A0A512AS30_9BACT|nr:DUF4127 family protein [Adhaeribacter aerolatus]GEO02518.1 hypothetical protein AAE02nite_01820 [Adhaeribacter aerolatus]
MKQIRALLLLLFLLPLVGSAQVKPGYSAKILFIPLDDRPPCLQFTERMGLIGDAQVTSPPKELLGRYTTAGQSDKIISWLQQQDLKSYDAAIIALDMLAYGGLVGSRVHQVPSETALKRLEVLKTLKLRAPKLLVYGQNVVMRLAPTATVKNKTYSEKLAEWAEISVGTEASAKARTVQLESEIPAEGLADYKQARERNLKTNLKAIELVRTGVIDYLILSQDDAKPRGIHVADREKLIAESKRLGLTEKIAVQPGADEVSMLLLARALNKFYGTSPKIKAVYASEETRKITMPFEDKPLHQTVSYHIKATGSREVATEQEADLLFYVFADRFEKGKAESFANEIGQKVKLGKRVIVADVDPKGDVQGGDTDFTKALEKLYLFPELNGYASWNTAGNTIGTALPQGVVFNLAQTKLLNKPQIADRIWTAQNWFTLHRVLDDYYYHNLVRAQTNKYLNQQKASSNYLSDQATQQAETFGTKLLQDHLNQVVTYYYNRPATSRQKNINCTTPANLTFVLPWNRTFEADIDFDLKCQAGNQKAN